MCIIKKFIRETLPWDLFRSSVAEYGSIFRQVFLEQCSTEIGNNLYQLQLSYLWLVYNEDDD